MTTIGLYAPLANAQVKIGGKMLPAKGVVLDLKKIETEEDKYYLGGLLLPNVEILDLGFIPATFTEAATMNGYDPTDGVDANTDLAGLVVYNAVENNGIKTGIYLWDGEDWKRMNGTLSSLPAVAMLRSPSQTVGVIVRGYKSEVTSRIRRLCLAT